MKVLGFHRSMELTTKQRTSFSKVPTLTAMEPIVVYSLHHRLHESNAMVILRSRTRHITIRVLKSSFLIDTYYRNRNDREFEPRFDTLY